MVKNSGFCEDAQHAANTCHTQLTGVVKFTAIVRGREQRDQLTLGEELIAILDDLMGTANQVALVANQELADHLLERTRNKHSLKWGLSH